MGKLATMIFWGLLQVGVPLLASLLLLQTGCLHLTTVYAEFQTDTYNSNNNIQPQVTQEYEPFLVSYDDDDDGEFDGEEDDEDDDEDELEDFQEYHHQSDSENAIIIHDFISMSSSKVLMQVKGGEVDGVLSKADVGGTSESSGAMSETEHLKRLEKKFLNLFGMTTRPKRKQSSVKRTVPKELMDLYVKQTNAELPTTDLLLPGKLTRSANTVRVWNPKEVTLIDNAGGEFHATLKFDLLPSSIPENEKITGAELRVLFSITLPALQSLDIDIASPSVFARVLLHDVIKNGTSSHQRKRPLITQVIDSKLVNLTNRKFSNFWLTFDIFPAVLRWMTGSTTTGYNRTSVKSNNYGVALQIVGLKGESHESIKGVQEFNMKLRNEKDIISLLLYTDDGFNKKGKRSKRETNSSSKNNSKTSQQRKLKRATQHHYHHQQQYYRNHNQHHYHYQYGGGGGGRRRKPHRHKNRRRNLCSKKPMFVDFTDVGWNDWIVAPPGYQAYYCSGECPFPMAEHLNATNHAVIQALINSMNPSLVPPPCCVPNKYSSLSLLYTDSSDRIVLKNYNEMVVDSCGCS